MTSLGELLFHLFMNLDISFQGFNLSFHLVISVQKLLGLFRLVLQLRRQLMILQNGQPRRRLQLLIIQRQQICFGFFNFIKHFFSQLFSCLNLFSFLLLAFGESIFSFLFEIGSELSILTKKFFFFKLEFVIMVSLLFKLLQLVSQLQYLLIFLLFQIFFF